MRAKHTFKIGRILATVAGSLMACFTIFGQQQGAVTFANNGSCLVMNGFTGTPVQASDGYQVGLFSAPLGSQNFTQAGVTTALGAPLPGIFAAGTRYVESPAAGASMQFQVRAWPNAYATFDEALQHGALLGVSQVVEMAVDDANALPAVPPLSLTANNLQGFAIMSPGNHAPSATHVEFATAAGTPLCIAVSNILAAVTDVDGDPLTVSSWDRTSSHGGTVAFTNATFIYSPNAYFQGSDSFSVRVSDGRGGIATVPVTVFVIGTTSLSGNQLSISCVSGRMVISFAGSPGQNYVIQSAPAIGGPWTDFSSSITVGTSAKMGYNDVQTASTPARFYRVALQQ